MQLLRVDVLSVASNARVSSSRRTLQTAALRERITRDGRIVTENSEVCTDRPTISTGKIALKHPATGVSSEDVSHTLAEWVTLWLEEVVRGNGLEVVATASG